MTRLVNNPLALIAFTLFVLLSVTSIVGAQPRKRPTPRQTYETGTERARQELQRIDKLLSENIREIQKLIFKIEADSIEAGDELTGGGHHPLANAISKLKEALSYYNAGKSLSDGDLDGALSEVAGLIAKALAEKDPRLKVAVSIEDYLIKAVEAGALLRQYAKLVEIRANAERAYNKLEYKRNQVELDKFLRNLRGDPEIERRAFQEAAERYNVDPQAVAEGAMTEAAAVSVEAASQVAQGVRIIDPNQDFWDLEKIPGINPDFIAAVEGTERDINNWLQALDEARLACPSGEKVESATCLAAKLRASDARNKALNNNRYPDGSYIPAFGESQGNTASVRPRSIKADDRRSSGDSTTKSKQPAANAGPVVVERVDGPNGAIIQYQREDGTTGIEVDCGQWPTDRWKLLDETGKYELDGEYWGDLLRIPAGNYIVQPLSPGFQPLKVSIRDKLVTVVKLAAGAIEVHYKRSDAFKAAAVLDVTGTRVLDTQVGSEGATWVLPPGDYLVAVVEFNGLNNDVALASKPQKVTLQNGKTIEVDLRLNQ